MSKIGILTFHRASNYGAVLQTYALQTALKKLGADVSVIDYRCETVEKAHAPGRFVRAKGVKGILRFPGKLRKYMVFSAFRKRRLHLTQKADGKNVSNIVNSYDALVAGSDQLWSKDFSGVDKTYFMPFSDSIRKYTYAISVGDKSVSTELKENLERYADSIRGISLREESAKQKIEELCHKECRVDLDPTFLLSKNEWNRIAKRPKTKNPYILIYTVADPINLIETAKKMAGEKGWDIFYLNSSFTGRCGVKKVRYSTPEEFVGWFTSAECIFTNSFHGTAFSIITEKEFYVEGRSKRGKNQRSLNLMSMVDIHDRDITADYIETEEINWVNVNQRITELRKNSIDYLSEIENDKGETKRE